MVVPSEKSTKVSSTAICVPAENRVLKMIARKDVVYTLGGIVNHDGGRLNQDKCNLLNYFFSVEKRKTGEYLAAKVVS